MGTHKKMMSLLLLAVLLISLANAEIVFNFVTKNDPCVDRCKEAQMFTSYNEKYVTSSCQRGCRFFNLIDLRGSVEPNDGNGTLDSCDSSCTEAYTVWQDSLSCRLGCVFMAKHNGVPVNSIFAITMRLDDGHSSPNLLLLPGDVADSDIFNEAGLAKELLPGWWDNDGFKLPETYFKTVPIDSGTIDNTGSFDHMSTIEKSSTIPGSDWLLCASRHTGIPRWLLVVAIVTAASSALWLCLSPDKSSEPPVDKVTLVAPELGPSKITVYLPDEAPLHKKPPPKYYDVVDMNDPSIQV